MVAARSVTAVLSPNNSAVFLASFPPLASPMLITTFPEHAGDRSRSAVFGVLVHLRDEAQPLRPTRSGVPPVLVESRAYRPAGRAIASAV